MITCYLKSNKRDRTCTDITNGHDRTCTDTLAQLSKPSLRPPAMTANTSPTTRTHVRHRHNDQVGKNADNSPPGRKGRGRETCPRQVVKHAPRPLRTSHGTDSKQTGRHQACKRQNFFAASRKSTQESANFLQREHAFVHNAPRPLKHAPAHTINRI